MLVENIVKRTLSQENLQLKIDLEGDLLKTFGTWQDSQSAEKIIEQIYSSRNSDLSLS